MKEWWEGKARDIVKGGVTSVQLLMSHFFLATLKNSLDNSASGFDDKVAVALAILKGDVQLSYRTSETPNMEGQSDEDISKKTFH